MSLPAHVTETTVTTTTYWCGRCGSRITPGAYSRPEYGQQVLAEWLERHAHAPIKDEPK